MRPPRPIHVVLAALAALGVAIGVLVTTAGGGGGTASSPPRVAPARSQLPQGFFGMVTEDAFANPGSYRAKTLDQEARTGVQLVRQTFDWSQIELTPGHYNLAPYDSFVASLAERHMQLLPVLLNTPRFRSSAPARGGPRGDYPPRNYADMGAFAAMLVRRYGPNGSLWRDRPDLPKVPVRAWQIWNEPSLPAYWPSGPDPAQYTRLLKVTSAAIRRVDPHADIVTAGLPDSRLGIPFDRFLKGMYKAGAASAFDTLAIHPYATNDEAVLGAVGQARRIADQNHDSRAKIWVTELGWASGGPRSAFTVGPQGQASRITATLLELTQLRTQLGLRGIIYFGWRDGAPYPPLLKDFWGLHTGLITRQGDPKPALRAFARTVASLERASRSG